MTEKPSVFIGSSKEGLDVAKAVQLKLERYAEVTVWDDGVFHPTDYVWESLEEQLEASDCGVFVLTPDDVAISRGTEYSVPRDNVVYELGLFAGKLGRRRAIILAPRNGELKLPSDLVGVVYLEYEYPSDPAALEARVAPACTRLLTHLRRLGARSGEISWEETRKHTLELKRLLNRPPGKGGFKADVFVGLSQGGIIIADLLSRAYGAVPIACLWAEHDTSSEQEYAFGPPDNLVNGHVLEFLRDSVQIRNILVLDDVAARGNTLARAKTIIRDAAPGKRVKTASLLDSKDTVQRPDFVARTTDGRVRTPFTMDG